MLSGRVAFPLGVTGASSSSMTISMVAGTAGNAVSMNGVIDDILRPASRVLLLLFFFNRKKDREKEK